MTTEDTKEGAGRPLLDWLLEKYPDTPKKRAKQWITAGRVSVSGAIIRRPHQVISDPGDELELLDRAATTLDCGPAGWPIHPRVTLLHLDASLAVVNKGPGLIAVPAREGDLSALSILADFLVGRLRARDHRVAGRSLPPAYRRLHPEPVHRIDQYTSGVFCLAMNPVARANLIEQLRAHTMERNYVAYVEGRPPQPQGTWRNWLRLDADERRQWVVSATEAQTGRAGAVEAITHYETIREFPRAGRGGVVTKLRLRLETGLKHQIRAQAAQAGLPLVGDRTYRVRSPVVDFPRQALHAETLSLEHPDQPGPRMSWTASLPRDLHQLEARLNAGRRIGSRPVPRRAKT